MPKKCQNIEYRNLPREASFDLNRRFGIYCNNDFDENMLIAFAKTWNNCTKFQQSVLEIFIRPNHKNIILNQTSLGIFKLPDYLVGRKQLYIFILEIKGLDIESNIYLDGIYSIEIKSGFNLYKKNQLVKGCQDFEDSNFHSFIFKNRLPIFTKFNQFRIVKPISKYPICSFFFSGIQIQYLKIELMANTFFINNVVSFVDSKNELMSNFNSSIDSEFIIHGVYGINIDTKLQNFLILIYFSIPRHLDYEVIRTL